MEKVTFKTSLTVDEVKSIAQKMIEPLNNHNGKPISNVADIITLLSFSVTSVIQSIGKGDPSAARNIWANVGININEQLKRSLGSFLDIKLKDTPIGKKGVITVGKA